MKTSEMDGARRYIKYAIIILVVALVLLGVFLVGEYRSLRKAQIISARELQLSAILKNHGPLTASDINIIRPWMTFDYINKLFNLPPDYLKTQLSISDVRYPQLSLSGYANYIHLNIATFTSEVTSTLRDYLMKNAK